MKRLISFLLALVLVCTMLPHISYEVGASATKWDVINAKGVSGNDIVAQARKYIGVPYDTSGGNYKYRTGFGSTMMFDCSGFVYRVCRDVGLASSRQNYTMGQTDTAGNPLEGQDADGNYYITAHTQEQRYYGQDISAAVNKYINTGDYSGLQPGDLLFITGDGSSVSHVVIYAGDGKIIHSEGYHGSVAEHPIGRYPTTNNWYFDGCRLIGASHIPVGAMDGVEGGALRVRVTGWVYDRDDLNRSVTVHVYVGSTYVGQGVADQYRPDVDSTCLGVGKYHGYDLTFSVPESLIGMQEVTVYAIDEESDNNPLLEGGSKTVEITEHIESSGHDYVGVKTEATCTSAGYTTYTCSVCGDSYIDNSDSWSEWSAVYPTGIPANLIEQKTQYSTLKKEFTTSESGTLEGWTNCGTSYSDWSTIQATTTKPVESDTLRITDTVQTGWGYYHWCNYYYNGGNNWNVDSVEYGSPCYWHGYTSSFALPAISIQDHGGQQAYGGNGSGAVQCDYNFYIWFRNPGADTYTYSYQTRNEVNKFYRWSDTWTEWSDEKITETEDVRVKTQTVYRYTKIPGHNYVKGICSRCGQAMAPTLEKVGSVWKCMLDGKPYTANTLIKYNGNWYHVKGGVWVRDTGFVKYNGNTYYVVNGLWSKTTTSLVKLSNGSYAYVKDGVQDLSNTLFKYNGNWYHVKGGLWVRDTGFVKYNGNTYYVVNGLWSSTTTALIKISNGSWVCVKEGVQDMSNTLFKYNGKYYHVNKGVWVKDTTLIKYNGNWLYVRDGVFTKMSTFVKYNGGTYYVKDGVYQNVTGFVNHNGTYYYLVNGVLDVTNSLVKSNNKWYHLVSGKWVRDTALVARNGNTYYVKNGLVDFTYTGTFQYNGQTYNIVKGVVK